MLFPSCEVIFHVEIHISGLTGFIVDLKEIVYQIAIHQIAIIEETVVIIIMVITEIVMGT